MYGIVLDRASPFSLVRQLCECLRKRILDGDIPSGARLPSTRLLASELGVARNVVIDAYEQLEAEGYLTGVVGSGTTVTDLGEGISRKAAPGRRGPSGRGSAALVAAAARASAPAGRPSPAEGRIIDFASAPAGRPAPAEGRIIDFASAPAGRPSPAEGRIIDFASACGIPDLASFPYSTWRRCFARALDEARPEDLSFSDIRGDRGLRGQIAALLYRMRGIACDPDQVFITRGITHALSLVARFLRRRTSSALLEDPLLNSFKRELAAAGYGIGYVPVDEEGMATGAIPDSRDSALFLVSSSHQFPTGGILPIARRLELLSAAEARGGWIFEDDYDGDIRLRGLPVPPIATLDSERVFYSGTFNKTLFPAIRTGYLVVPERLSESFAAFRLGISDWMESIPGKALASFIRDGHYERRALALKRLYARRRDLVAAGVESLLGERAIAAGAEAGCHCRIRIRIRRGAAGSVRSPAARLGWDGAPAFGVKVATVERYISDPRSAARRFKGDILIGYGNLGVEEIEEGMERLRRFIASRG